MRVVLVGASSVAIATARILLGRHHEVVIVEREKAKIDSLAGSLDCGFLNGDGSRPAILKEAGPAQTDVLICLTNHDQDNILAEEFIPLAEECGLIRAVGEWTLERALSQVGAWQHSLPGALWFALNVSASELAQGEEYVTRLRQALSANGVDGSRIELELTERVLMAHFSENVETLRRIGELGVSCSIDDFGTGYSSLAYLRQLPIDKLKIDRSFLHELETHPADESIVRTITAMARTLGLAVVAEGVETAAQLERVLALGCEEWQGHHYSWPLEAAEFERLLMRRDAAAS